MFSFWRETENRLDLALHNSVSVWCSKHTRIQETSPEFEKCICDHWVIIHSHLSLWSVCEETGFSLKGWISPLSVIPGTAQPGAETRLWARGWSVPGNQRLGSGHVVAWVGYSWLRWAESGEEDSDLGPWEGLGLRRRKVFAVATGSLCAFWVLPNSAFSIIAGPSRKSP